MRVCDTLGTLIHSLPSQIDYYTDNASDKYMYRIRPLFAGDDYVHLPRDCVESEWQMPTDALPADVTLGIETDKVCVAKMERLDFARRLVVSHNSAHALFSKLRNFTFPGDITSKSVAMHGDTPVFVNYGFARSQRNMAFFPPELVCNISGEVYDKRAHDAWALAIVLLSAQFEKSIIAHVGYKFRGNKSLKQLVCLFNKNMFGQLYVVLHICFLQHAIGNGMFPNKCLFTNAFMHQVRELDAEAGISRVYKKCVPESMCEKFKKWLSWCPEDRL